MLEIPLKPEIPRFTIRVTLDGSEYEMLFDWLGRRGVFLVSLHASDGTPLIRGMQLTSNWPLLRRFKADVRVPRGEMLAVSLVDSEPAALSDLGTRVKLYYIPEDELAEIEAEA